VKYGEDPTTANVIEKVWVDVFQERETAV